MGTSPGIANQISLVIFGYFVVSVVVFVLMALMVVRRRHPGHAQGRPQPALQRGELIMFAAFGGGLIVVMAFAVAQLVLGIRF